MSLQINLFLIKDFNFNSLQKFLTEPSIDVSVQWQQQKRTAKKYDEEMYDKICDVKLFYVVVSWCVAALM